MDDSSGNPKKKLAAKDQSAGSGAAVVIGLAALALALPVVRHWPIDGTLATLSGDRAGAWIVMVSSLLLVVSWCAAIGRPRRFGWVVLLLPAFWPLYDANVGVWLTARELDYSDLAGGGIGLMIGYTIVARRSIMGLFIGHETAAAERMRRRFKWWVLRRAIRDRANLGLFATTAMVWFAATAAAIAGVWGAWWWMTYDLYGSREAAGTHDFVTMVALFAIAMLYTTPAAVIHLMRKTLLVRAPVYAEARPCFLCKASCTTCEFDAEGWSVCGCCGTEIHRGQWIAPPVLVTRRMPVNWKSALRSAMQTGAMILAITALSVMVLFAFGTSAPQVALWLTGVLFSMTAICVFIASIQQMRRTIERIYANQHVRCRECDYDLKGTPVDRGVGVCPECGVEFADFSGGAADARGS